MKPSLFWNDATFMLSWQLRFLMLKNYHLLVAISQQILKLWCSYLGIRKIKTWAIFEKLKPKSFEIFEKFKPKSYDLNFQVVVLGQGSSSYFFIKNNFELIYGITQDWDQFEPRNSTDIWTLVSRHHRPNYVIMTSSGIR